MDLKLFILTTVCLALGFSTAYSQQHNTLTTQEKQEGWELLFDGETTEGWRGYNKEQFPEEGWIVENGMLSVIEGGGGGDIITTEVYEDYILKLEWRVAKGANGGIFYAAVEQPEEAIYWSAPEIQILDNDNHPDAERGKDGNRKATSLYDLIPAEPQNANPFGEWNQITIEVTGNGAHVEHWMNGEKVVEYERWTDEWYEMLQQSKFAPHPEFGAAHEGYIGLQDHGNRVDFRNIKIKVLD
ncbi:DUF1080 domain-containing protein [Halalkalibaculum sp. DA384]|uniref:3-keto-disaccharide hydrolase n=1 Tax=Halalkalibaculum sp. DA384 TaxID=3373606 RepID=UPI0037553076